MIIINLMGGVGNQLFQYAAGKALANHHGVNLYYTFQDDYKLAKRSIRIDNFKILGKPLPAKAGLDYFPKRKLSRVICKLLGKNYEGKIYREHLYFEVDPVFFNHSSDSYLYGFWQSYGYFSGIEGLIREEFVLRNPSLKYLKALESIMSLPNPVSIHVRRGDYLKDESGFYPLSQDYYNKAIEYIINRFGKYDPVVFTDDETWVRDNFAMVKDPIFASDYELEDFEELMLMAQCSHHVIANSSFSWWGAWLNVNPDKCVVAPTDWHSLYSDNSKLIPTSWIQIS